MNGARGMAVSLLQYANREAVAKALTAQGYSVSRNTVNRWARGAEMPTIAARMIGELFGHHEHEEAAPHWAERLADDAVGKVIGALSRSELTPALARLLARLEELQPPLGEASDDPVDAPAPGAAAPPDRAAE